jgi:hypothetical protein
LCADRTPDGDKQTNHPSNGQDRIAHAQDGGLETICALTAAAAVASRSAKVCGSPLSAGTSRRRSIWGSML